MRNAVSAVAWASPVHPTRSRVGQSDSTECMLDVNDLTMLPWIELNNVLEKLGVGPNNALSECTTSFRSVDVVGGGA